MKRPKPDQLRHAADWCDDYEGGELALVAKFLRNAAQRQEKATVISRLVRKGVSRTLVVKTVNRMYKESGVKEGE